MYAIQALILVALVGGVGYLAFMQKQLNDNKDIASKTRARQRKVRKAREKHKKYWDSPIHKKSFRSAHSLISSFSMLDDDELVIQTLAFYTKSLNMSIAFFVVGAFAMGDVISILTLLLFAIVFRKSMLELFASSIERRAYVDLRITLSSIGEWYSKTKNVPDALLNATRSPLLDPAITEIYDIITGDDGEVRLDKFCKQHPFRILQTLAAACYFINNEGDSKTKESGSAFKDSLHIIKEEISVEVRKSVMAKAKFGVLQWIPLFPPFMCGLIQSTMSSQIPGTAIVYQGIIGYALKVTIILLSIFSFNVIQQITGKAAIAADDRFQFFKDLLEIKWYRKLVDGFKIKRLSKVRKFNKFIDASISRKTLEYVYAEKIFYSFVTFCCVFIISLVALYLAKDFVKHNTAAMSLGSTPVTVEHDAALYIFDLEYLERERKLIDSDLVATIQGVCVGMGEFDAVEQADRIQMKYDTYHDMYYRWQFCLGALFCGFIAWFSPHFSIFLRNKRVQTEALEDVLQLQTLISILMYTSMDNYAILNVLSKNSVIHKEVITYAFYEYASDPEWALTSLKSKSPLTEFQEMVDKLLSCNYDTTMINAFDDLIADKAHSMKLRETANQLEVNKKYSIISPLSLVSSIALLVYFMLPIVILGLNEYEKLMSTSI